MKREVARELLIPCLDGEVDPQTARLLEAHLESDHELRNELEELRELFRAIETAPAVAPDEEMRRAFLDVLARAKQENPGRPPLPSPKARLLGFPLMVWLGAAAACVVAGAWIGWQLAYREDALREVEHHQTLAEVQELRRDVSLLRGMLSSSRFVDRPAGFRLQTMNLARELDVSDPKVMDALFDTLETDPNPNVRMAALEALRQFQAEPALRSRLAGALAQQTNPAVQIALIAVLVDSGAAEAREPIQRLLLDPMVAPVVKGAAQRGLTRL